MPWSPDSAVLNRSSLPFRPSQVANSGCSSIRYFGNEPADVALHAQRPALHDGAGLVDVLGVLVDVLPVLEHRVDLAVGHRLEHRDLGDLGHLDLAAELVLEHRLGDVGVGGRAGPGLLVQHDLAAVLGTRALIGAAAVALVVLLLAARRREQRQHQRHHDGQRPSRALPAIKPLLIVVEPFAVPA